MKKLSLVACCAFFAIANCNLQAASCQPTFGEQPPTLPDSFKARMMASRLRLAQLDYLRNEPIEVMTMVLPLEIPLSSGASPQGKQALYALAASHTAATLTMWAAHRGFHSDFVPEASGSLLKVHTRWAAWEVFMVDMLAGQASQHLSLRGDFELLYFSDPDADLSVGRKWALQIFNVNHLRDELTETHDVILEDTLVQFHIDVPPPSMNVTAGTFANPSKAEEALTQWKAQVLAKRNAAIEALKRDFAHVTRPRALSYLGFASAFPELEITLSARDKVHFSCSLANFRKLVAYWGKSLSSDKRVFIYVH